MLGSVAEWIAVPTTGAGGVRTNHKRESRAADPRRELTWGDAEVHIVDRLESADSFTADRIVLARSYTGIHMGSTRYLLSQDLARMPEEPVGVRLRKLGPGNPFEARQTIRFGAAGRAEFTDANR